ncbi:hypothetical protein F1728_06525 [Gimesia benthica]|uniref:Leucine-rich repeat domain-containing protein n=1 Tax=Gimesia benthica TaxID=2608982 RepID=A0A6I6A7K3_9PLAN|nr:hypothetical protein [Gimesia benthica]QGQ22347.1 hypothetical protein F1728_06525 [Gimesia benthica]
MTEEEIIKRLEQERVSCFPVKEDGSLFITMQGSEKSSDAIANICKQICKLERISKLDFSNTALRGSGLQELQGLPNVKYIDLSRTMIAGLDYKYLKSFPKLEELHCSPISRIDEAMVYIGQNKGIKNLGLFQVRISDMGFEALSDLKHLEKIDITGAPISKGFHALLNFKNLRELTISETQADDSTLEMIGHLLNMEELFFSHTLVTNEGFNFLGDLNNLTTLGFSGQRVTKDGVKQLVTGEVASSLTLFPRLDYIHFCDIPFDSESVKILATLKKVGHMNFDKSCPMSDSDKIFLKNSLPNCDIWF